MSTSMPFSHDDRICKKLDRTDSLRLICVNHPTKYWWTKNIDWIGARKIFFDGERQPDGSFKDGSPYAGCSELQEIKYGLEGVNQYCPSEPTKWPIDTFEVLLERIEAIKHTREKYSYPCDCPLSDLVISPEYDSLPEKD